MKTHYSAAALAARKLPGLPGTERNIRAMADREGWDFHEVAARGGKLGKRREYAYLALPEAARLLLAEDAAGAGLPAVVEPCAVAVRLPQVDQPLKGTQLDAEIARDRITKFIADFDGTNERAIDHLNVGFHTQTLSGPLTWAMKHAWSKRRADCRLTRHTLAKWQGNKKKRGRSAPLVRQKDMETKPWYALAVALKQRPQGSCLTWITEQVADAWQPAWGAQPPSGDTVRRFFRDKFSQIDQLKGRHTGSALSPHKHYTQRTSAGLLPWDEVHADGWNTHFTAPHPVTGEYVTYEVWHAHDVATRYVPPFGIGLTENFEVIAKCVEHAVRFGGVMATLQTDSTKIVKNNEIFKLLSDRVGFTVAHPQTVGNSQANGIAENFNSWLDKECRELATYQAKGMDSLTLKRTKKLTAKAVRLNKAGDFDGYAKALQEAARMGKGRVFTSHPEAIEWLEMKRQKWNAKPHRSLPKIRDAVTGNLRHQSPDEALQGAREQGWKTDEFSEDYLVTLFRPHKPVKVMREAVSPYGGMRYHHECLGDWNGKEVVVAYDVMDWRQVWVKTLALELICVANFSEAAGYRTLTAQQANAEKRALARIKHKLRQIEGIREEVGLGEGETLDGESSRIPENQSLLARSDEELAEVEALRADKPLSHRDTVMWLFPEPDVVDEPLKEEAAS